MPVVICQKCKKKFTMQKVTMMVKGGKVVYKEKCSCGGDVDPVKTDGYCTTMHGKNVCNK